MQARERGFAARRVAEMVAVLASVEHLVARELIQESEHQAIVVGRVHRSVVGNEQATQLERWALPLQAQTLSETARRLAERVEARVQRVVESRRQLCVRTLHGQEPQAAR